MPSGVDIEAIKQQEQMIGFVVLPHRWVVERSFAWFGLNRQLSIVRKLQEMGGEVIQPDVPSEGETM